MQSEDPIHEKIKTIMIDIMAVLYENGFKEVHVGAMMRLLGVNENKAAQHDGDIVPLDENFATMLTELNKNTAPVDIPPGTIFH